MKNNQIIHLKDIKEHIKTVLTPEKIKSFCHLTNNLEQHQREHYEMTNLLSVICYNLQQFTADKRGEILLKTIQETYNTMGITKEQFLATSEYIDFIKEQGYEWFEAIHDGVIDTLSNNKSLKKKLLFMGLNNKIDEKELIKLSDDFIYHVINHTHFPVNFLEQLNDFKATNTKLTTFNESTFIVLNTIILEYCMYETKHAKPLNKLMNKQLFKEMLILPENIVEANKKAVIAFGLTLDMLNMGIDFNELSGYIFDGKELPEYVEKTTVKEDVKTDEDVEFINETKVIQEESKALSPREIHDAKFADLTSEQRDNIWEIESFFESSKKEASNEGLFDPNFALYNYILEVNNYKSYTVAQLKDLLKRIPEQQENDKEPSIVAQIKMITSNFEQRNKYVKEESEKSFYKVFDVNKFNDICTDAKELNFDFVEYIKTQYKDLRKQVEELHILSINPIDASLLDKVKSDLLMLLSNTIFVDYKHKGIAMGVLFDNGIDSALSSYMNLIQLVELIENGYIKGQDMYETINRLHKVIRESEVTLSFRNEDLIKGEIDGDSLKSNSETNHLRTMKVFDIFEGINDLVYSNKRTEMYATFGKILLPNIASKEA